MPAMTRAATPRMISIWVPAKLIEVRADQSMKPSPWSVTLSLACGVSVVMSQGLSVSVRVGVHLVLSRISRGLHVIIDCLFDLGHDIEEGTLCCQGQRPRPRQGNIENPGVPPGAGCHDINAIGKVDGLGDLVGHEDDRLLRL